MAAPSESNKKQKSDGDTYKLTYFALRGRGEVARLIFAAAGVAYEDDRIEREKWPAFKPNTPFKQMPLLSVNGGPPLPQSRAIELFLSRRFGLLGKTDIEAAFIHAVLEELTDIRLKYNDLKNTANAEAKEAAIAKFQKETLLDYFAWLEAYTKDHGTAGHFVGDSLSVADIVFYQFCFVFDNQDALTNALKANPLLAQIREKVPKNAGIAKWLETRPVTAL